MTIEQFEDKGLAHFSYIVMSEGEIAIIDPARNPHPYYEFAMLHDARIVAVVETHPHADFVSSHLEISHTREVPVYASKRTQAAYQHRLSMPATRTTWATSRCRPSTPRGTRPTASACW